MIEEKEINELTILIIGAAIEVHKTLGPGLLESIYHTCLAHELSLKGINYQTEVQIPIEYKGKKVCGDYRADFIVENRVLREIKAVDRIVPVHEAQLLTYLKLSGKKIGLLINFNVPVLKQGIRRRIL